MSCQFHVTFAGPITLTTPSIATSAWRRWRWRIKLIRKTCSLRWLGVIGASGVGKTVYLGMLMDMLSQPAMSIQALARGAFSITMQQNTISALARCAFPRKTPNEPDRWNWVHCQVRRPEQRQDMEVLMPDMAGEAILEEVDHPHSFRIISQFLGKSMGAMVLIDASQLKEGGRDQDFFSMKLLSYLSELDSGRSMDGGNGPWP